MIYGPSPAGTSLVGGDCLYQVRLLYLFFISLIIQSLNASLLLHFSFASVVGAPTAPPQKKWSLYTYQLLSGRFSSSLLYYKTFSPKIHYLFKIHVSKNLITQGEYIIIAACTLPRKNKDFSVSECAEFPNRQSTSLMAFFFSFWLLI